MTLQELTELFNIQSDLARYQEMLAALEARATPGAQVLTGMPHASGIRDTVGDLAVEIADLRDTIRELEAEAERVGAKVEAFISTFQDVQTRTMLRLRFLRGMTWKEVAGIVGGGNSEASVKMACYRAIEKGSGV